MKNPKLANRYANSLFQFAIENQKLEEVKQDLDFLKKIFKENHNLQVIIDSPIIYPAKKRTIFAELFGQQINEITLGFFNLLIQKKREPALVSICDEFIDYYNKHHNIKVAFITTAHPLGEELKAELIKLLETQTKSTIEIVEIHNPQLIGGLSIKIEDFLFDASIVAKINRLKAEFSHNIYQANY